MLGNSHVRFGEGDEETYPGNGARRLIPTPPAAMAVLKKIESQLLDRVADGHHCPFGFGLAPGDSGDLDRSGRQGRDIVAGFGFDILDLTAVAAAVEGNDDDGDSGGGKSVEQGSLINRPDVGDAAGMVPYLSFPIGNRAVDGGVLSIISHDR
jgi:hypothetical protein